MRALLLLLVIGLYFACLRPFIGYINDDAFITFRYSRFLALGRGPYYNLGEHVEGYTNFSLMLVLSALIRLAGPDAALPAAKAIGVLCALLSLGFAFGLARRVLARESASPLTADACGALAAGLLAVSPGLAVNSSSGLETTLFDASLIAGVTFALEGWELGRALPSACAFACAVWTRPEAVAVFAFFCIAYAVFCVRAPSTQAAGSRPARLRAALFERPQGRALCLSVLVVLGAALAHEAFRVIAYDGAWLPNTYYAKAGGFWKVNASRYVRIGAFLPFLGLAGTLVAALCALFPGPARARLLSIWATGLFGSFLPFFTGTDWMLGERLEVPYLPLLSVAVAVGWSRGLARIRRCPGWLAFTLCFALVAAAFVSQAPQRRAYARTVAIRGRGYVHGHAALAAWLCGGLARPGDTLALMDIGIIGYRCIDQRIVDITGLTDRVIARSPGGFLQKRFDPRYVLNPRTRFVIAVLTAPGDGRRPPPRDVELRPWTSEELSLLSQPEFRRYYVRLPQGPEPTGSWLARIAWQIGAERVFSHDYPGRYYLLSVFRRHAQPNPL